MGRTKGGTMGRIAVEVDLVNYADKACADRGAIPADQVRRLRAKGMVDTGATFLVLPKSALGPLGLVPASQKGVRYADHRRATRSVVEGVQLELLGRRGLFNAVVEPKRKDILIGAVVLETLDLLVDCRTQTLQPRDPDQILTEIE